MLILNLAALRPVDVGDGAPHLSALADVGTLSPLVAPLPMLTCSSHATMTTGLSPGSHGVVGNGWYDRDQAKVLMWSRSDHCVRGEKLWEAARRREPAFSCANLFWRYCADSSCDLRVTEQPLYWASGR